jgi:hypothetical protein
MGTLFSCGSPNPCAFGHAIEEIQAVEPVTLELDPIVFSQADAWLAEIQLRQEVVVEGGLVGMVQAHRHCDVRPQAGIETDLPPMTAASVVWQRTTTTETLNS